MPEPRRINPADALRAVGRPACGLSGCELVAPVPVTAQVGGVTLVGHACTDAHAVLLVQGWVDRDPVYDYLDEPA